MSKSLFQKSWTYYKLLHSMKGMGASTVKFLFQNKGLNKIMHPKKAKQSVVIEINKILQHKRLKRDLIKDKKADIEFYYNARSCKGIRHHRKYPIRGQRTHTNAKTKKRLQTKR